MSDFPLTFDNCECDPKLQNDLDDLDFKLDELTKDRSRDYSVSIDKASRSENFLTLTLNRTDGHYNNNELEPSVFRALESFGKKINLPLHYVKTIKEGYEQIYAVFKEIEKNER